MYLPMKYGNLDLVPGPRVYNLHRASQIIPPALGGADENYGLA